MNKAFASQPDLQEKPVSFIKLSDNAYAYTAEGDPNTGVIVGGDAVMVVDTQATPVMAQDLIRRIRAVTDKPIKYGDALALPCGAGPGCFWLQAGANHCQSRHQ